MSKLITHHYHPLTLVACCAVGALLALGASVAMAKPVRLDSSCRPQLSRTEQRLYEKSLEGPAALRSFMDIRRGMLQMDVRDAWDRAVSIETARAACLKSAG